MEVTVIGFVLLGLAVVLQQAPAMQQLRWHNRVVLVFSPDEQNAQLTQQKEAFGKVAAELRERDIKVFAVTGDGEDTRNLRKQFGVTGDVFAVVLVGKDGSSKLRCNQPVPPAEIFHLVDAMPMRQDEIRQRK